MTARTENPITTTHLWSLASRYWLWPIVAGVCAIVFFALPGGYGGTAHSLLHGLCAQTPSHTLQYGDKALPFDSRMTGIYGGSFVTLVWLAVTGRFLRFGTPPKLVIAILAGLVALMAIDGTNSLLNDLGMWHPHEPSNELRVITGYGTGVALAIALSWLLSSSIWRLASSETIVGRVRDLWVPLAGLGGYGLLLTWRPVWLHLPVSVLLVVSAWAVVTMLALVIVLLALRLDSSIQRPHELHIPVATASMLALLIMIGLASLRFWIEHTFGISNTMM